MDFLLTIALLLPFTGRWKKSLTAIAFAIAIITSAWNNYFIATFFFGLSLVLIWLSDWDNNKYPLFFLAMFDLIGILTSSNLLELFLYFELAIYASYFLIFDTHDLRSVFRYFVVNSIGSAFMLFAVAIGFYQTGSLTTLPGEGVILFVLGLLIKLGISPFQDWLVEIYRKTSLSSKIYFSAILTEISPLALLIVVTEPSQILQAFSMFSMFIANMMALTETSMRRVLALFDASNLAYDLMAIAVASEASRAAALYMMFAHVLAMSFAFTALEISKSRNINDLRAPEGLKLPFYVSFFVLSGLPPFHTFPSKLLLFSSVFSASHPLSLFLLFNLILSAFASLRVLSSIKGTRKIRVNWKFRVFLYGMLLISVVLGLYPLVFSRLVNSQMFIFMR